MVTKSEFLPEKQKESEFQCRISTILGQGLHGVETSQIPKEPAGVAIRTGD